MKPAMKIPQEPGTLTFTLLHLLGDGEFHSGEVLAQQLGISRASVSGLTARERKLVLLLRRAKRTMKLTDIRAAQKQLSLCHL